MEGASSNGADTYDGNLKRVKQVVDGETIYSVYGQSGALLTRHNVTTGEQTEYLKLGGGRVVRLKNGTAVGETGQLLSLRPVR